MRAAVLEEHGEPLAIKDVDEPELDPAGVMIDVEACGICRSDWEGWTNSELTDPGQILGHEVAGTVLEVGSNVTTIREGDEVIVPVVVGDGVCHHCRNGRGNICENYRAVGFQESVQGGFAEQIHVPAADYNIVQLPDGVSMTEMAALGCRFTTAYHALTHQGDVNGGDWVAVHGCGGLGLSAVHIADALGARVVGVDLESEKLEKAEEVGASRTINASDTEDVPGSIMDITNGGANVSVDALGIAETCQNSVTCLEKSGTHVQAGLMDDQVTIPTALISNREIEFIGSQGMPPSRFDEILSMLEGGKVNPGALVTDHVSLDDVSDKLEAMNTYDTIGFSVVDSFT